MPEDKKTPGQPRPLPQDLPMPRYEYQATEGGSLALRQTGTGKLDLQKIPELQNVVLSI